MHTNERIRTQISETHFNSADWFAISLSSSVNATHLKLNQKSFGSRANLFCVIIEFVQFELNHHSSTYPNNEFHKARDTEEYPISKWEIGASIQTATYVRRLIAKQWLQIANRAVCEFIRISHHALLSWKVLWTVETILMETVKLSHKIFVNLSGYPPWEHPHWHKRRRRLLRE